MTTILHIASSGNLKNSVTRQIGAELLNTLKTQDPTVKIISRDLGRNPVPHLTPEMIEVFHQAGAAELAFSDQLVDEVLATDLLVIEAPMHNFSIPSVLKAWIDHILRSGRTFSYDALGPKGLAKNKKAILILGRGGVYSQGPAKMMDYQETYLRAILGFIGITEVESIYIEGVSMGPMKAAEALAAAKNKIMTLNAHTVS